MLVWPPRASWLQNPLRQIAKGDFKQTDDRQRFKFSKIAFSNGCINIKHMVKQQCFSFTDDSDIGVIVWLSFTRIVTTEK